MTSTRLADAPEPDCKVVLVVEDEILLRMSVSHDLRAAGYIVVEAATADEALSMLESGGQVDLVFSDIQMPGRLDGIGLVEAIIERFPSIPAILTSGGLESPSGRLGTDLLFIPKPYRTEFVLGCIAEVIERRGKRNAAGSG